MKVIYIFELNIMEWLLVIVSAILVGFMKTGISTASILVVTTLVYLFPAKESVGILLPMLLIGDLFAVIYYRRSVVWKHLLLLLPWVLVGLSIGYFVLINISSELLKPLLGGLVLLLILLHVLKERLGKKFNDALPTSSLFTTVMGVSGGFATMVGNVAGGILSIYLLTKKLPKQEFIGTGAWFFLTVNVIKVPLFISLDLITVESILFNFRLIPAILIGAFIGIKVLPIIPQKTFEMLVLLFSTIGGVKLLLG